MSKDSQNSAAKATQIGVFANTCLFLIKISAGLLSGSLAIISDAVNSLGDILYSIGVLFAVKIAHKDADSGHPFGHRGAEPIAGLFTAIIMAILGFSLIWEAVQKLLLPAVNIVPNEFILYGLIALFISIGTKAFLWRYFSRIGKAVMSPAIRASAIDARNDVLISFLALVGFIGPFFGFFSIDSYAAILIGVFVIYSGYKIGEENTTYLMGACPPKELLGKICKKAQSVKGVNGIHDVRAHYVGNFVHVEIHIEVNRKMTLEAAHKIGKEVQKGVESLKEVDKAYIHIDPRDPAEYKADDCRIHH